MRSRFLAVLAAVAFAVAPAAAQTQDNFQFQGAHPGAPVIDGAYISPYIGSFDGTLGPTSNGEFTTPFDIWCVDYVHQMTYGDTYNVWITPIDGSDFTHTRLGSALGYEWSAFLANQMDWLSSSGDVAGNDPAIQDAIWVLMGYTTPSQGGTARQTYLDTFGATLSLPSGWNNSAPTGTYAVFADWSIITCDRATGQDCPYQEFIFPDGTGTTTEVVPEPVTMTLLATGLAGMALAGRKRRRNTAA